MGFKLVSESNGQVYALPVGATLVVGRGAGCDVMVQNPNISRRHAQLRIAPDSIELEDLGSANGTFVNGDRGPRIVARPGDVITFGTATFRLEQTAEARSSAVTRPVPTAASAAAAAAAVAATRAKRKLTGTHVRPLETGNVGDIVSRLSAAAEQNGGAADRGTSTAPRSLRRQLDALLAVAAELLRERDVSGIMKRVAEHAVALLGADRMSVLLLDASGKLVQAVSRTADGGEVAKMVPQSIARRALDEKVAILTDDAGEDVRFTGDSVRKQLVRSAMCVPLFSEAGPLGVLYVDSITESKAFGADDLELTLAFAGIVAAAVERERLSERLRREAVVRSSFERYFAPALAERIAAAPENVTLGGERRTVAVLFSDIRGFSSWAEKLPADETARILSEYFGEMVECVFATGGTLDKFIGDALMAQWGAPLSTGGDAANALKAAWLMHERLSKLNEKWSVEGRPHLKVGIGIGYGEVFAGNIGSTRRLEYTVIGDVVNVASRLASLAAPGEVLISEDACEAMGGKQALPTAEELEQLQVRGRTRNVRVFRVHLTRHG
jgi:adenylate cyclase